MTEQLFKHDLIPDMSGPVSACPTCGSALKRSGGVFFCNETPVVIVGDLVIEMTWQEFTVLRILYENRPRVLDQGFLNDAVHPVEADRPEDRLIDVIICRLRRKLAEQNRISIDNVFGNGYRILEDQTQS